jgi:hypothetical protein
MKGNLTQAVAILSLMGGSAYKGSERYIRSAGLHTPNATWVVSENHNTAPAAFREQRLRSQANHCDRKRFRDTRS